MLDALRHAGTCDLAAVARAGAEGLLCVGIFDPARWWSHDQSADELGNAIRSRIFEKPKIANRRFVEAAHELVETGFVQDRHALARGLMRMAASELVAVKAAAAGRVP